MRIGAYQFPGSGNRERNFAYLRRGMEQAARENVRLLLFHECALTGYPPLEVSSPQQVDFAGTQRCLRALDMLARLYGMVVAVGTIEQGRSGYYNRVQLLGEGDWPPYDKRALWGWDEDNFLPGKLSGIYQIDGIKIGVRICFEVRFPEYFRELYRQGVQLCLMSFCDISHEENRQRYRLIRAHLATRACENAMSLLSANNCAEYQTAPTAFFSPDGKVLAQARRGVPQLLVWDYQPQQENFGTAGRRKISHQLLGLQE